MSRRLSLEGGRGAAVVHDRLDDLPIGMWYGVLTGELALLPLMASGIEA